MNKYMKVIINKYYEENEAVSGPSIDHEENSYIKQKSEQSSPQ